MEGLDVGVAAVLEAWDERPTLAPEDLTEILRSQIRALDRLGLTVVEVGDGHAVGSLPLSTESANQHGTIAAGNLAHLVDVVAAIALASVLRGVPFVGLHPRWRHPGAALWTAGLDIRYREPAADDTVAEATVDPESAAAIRQDFASGDVIVQRVPVVARSAGRVVLEANARFLLAPGDALNRSGSRTAPGALLDHYDRSSARLVAGLRAEETSRAAPLVVDPWAARLAGRQGVLLARAFNRQSPQLQALVASRTVQLDSLFDRIEDLLQVVLVGAGLDARPARLRGADRLTWFEVDLPKTSALRQELLPPSAKNGRRIPVAIDVTRDDVEGALRSAGFDAHLPSLIAVEGLTMYLTRDQNRKLLSSLAPLLRHPSSRLWVDIVHADVVEGRDDRASVRRFLEGMARLGEPFVFGLSDIEGFFRGTGLRVERIVDSSVGLGDRADEVADIYRFVELCGA
jgi:methyltransferase (TIGR00027 family)